MLRTSHVVLALSVLALAACAKSAPPLPGDSVSPDGGVTLTPPRISPVGAPVEAPAPAAPPGAVESRLFPPEVVMDHQVAIALTAAQKDAITREVERAQKELLALQWELSAEKEKLLVVLDEPRVDEDKSAKAAARLMERETKIKAAHLAMLVRVKNVLTAEQQQKLRALRDAGRPVRSGGRDAGPPAP
ncbi:MAG: hypothetical protein JNL38_06755 [Myxococcales bacterium]|nr:hypothetical protein [Myxococcales bacterium]